MCYTDGYDVTICYPDGYDVTIHYINGYHVIICYTDGYSTSCFYHAISHDHDHAISHYLSFLCGLYN